MPAVFLCAVPGGAAKRAVLGAALCVLGVFCRRKERFVRMHKKEKNFLKKPFV